MSTTKKKNPEQEYKKMLESVDAKAQELTTSLKRKVVPIILLDMGYAENGKYVIGYMFRPDLVAQLRMCDKGQAYASGFSMEEGSKVLESLLIKNESDSRINMETEEGEVYWKGAVSRLIEFVQTALPVIKKN